MSAPAVVRLSAVWAMLARCTESYTKVQTDHYWRIGANGKMYPSLPLGEHGPRKDPEIQFGHVKHMARQLGIYQCCARFFNL